MRLGRHEASHAAGRRGAGQGRPSSGWRAETPVLPCTAREGEGWLESAACRTWQAKARKPLEDLKLVSDEGECHTSCRKWIIREQKTQEDQLGVYDNNPFHEWDYHGGHGSVEKWVDLRYTLEMNPTRPFWRKAKEIKDDTPRFLAWSSRIDDEAIYWGRGDWGNFKNRKRYILKFHFGHVTLEIPVKHSSEATM